MTDSNKALSNDSKTPSQMKSSMKAPSKVISVKERQRPEHTVYKIVDNPALKAPKVGPQQKVRGFKKLKYQDQIHVNQVFNDLYELTGTRMSNVYSITIPNRFSFDPNDQTIIYYVYEEVSCEMAWLKTAGRRLCFTIINAETGVPLVLLTRSCRPCFCFTNMLPCCATNNLDAVLPDGRYFGTVRKIFHFANPKFGVFDAEGNKIFEVVAQNFGNICPCWLLTNNTLKVRRPGDNDEDTITAPIFIQKNYTNMCIENAYTLSVEPMMPNKNKVLLLALIVAIDFQHFKRFSTICHFFVWLVWIAAIFIGLALLFIYLIVCQATKLPCEDFEWPDLNSLFKD